MLQYTIIKGNPEGTITIADELIKHNITDNYLTLKKAKALFLLGRWQEALNLYKSELNKDKDKTTVTDFVYYERGLCLEQLGRLKEAHESYNLSIDYGGQGYVYDAIDRVLLKLQKLEEKL